MKFKSFLAVSLSLVLLLAAIPFVSAASPKLEDVNGVRTAFVSTFGKMNYGGKSYVSYKTIGDALNALGTAGGQIVLNGNTALSSFTDTPGRGKLSILGGGNKATASVIDFSGSGNITLGGDLFLDMLSIKLDPEAYLFTAGHTFETGENFDTYSQEWYVADGPNEIHHPDPMSVAPGAVKKDYLIYLDKGTYGSVTAGSADGKAVDGNGTLVLGKAFSADKVVAGSAFAGGVMNGNADVRISGGNVGTLVVGSADGTINGLSSVTVSGGSIGSVVMGGESAGAIVNGSSVAIINNTAFESASRGAGKVTGKTVLILGGTSDGTVENNAADIVIRVKGGYASPEFSGTALTGFRFTDSHGLSVPAALINGKSVTADNGIFALDNGSYEVAVEEQIKIALNSDAVFVNGYEDGTFRPQNNMTRAEAITLLTRVIADESVLKGRVQANYADVDNSAWYADYIGFFQQFGFLDAIASNHGTEIKPNEPITRGEFTALIYHVGTLGAGSGALKLKYFSDVKNDNPFVEAINYAASIGVINGYEDSTFRTDNHITRAEVVTMVNRLLGRSPNEAAAGTSFGDIADHWAKGQILAACGKKGEAWNPVSAGAGSSYAIKGTTAKEYVTALYDQSATLDGDAIREGVDVIAEQMKKDILNTPNMEIPKNATCYYISEKHGDDKNDGKTPETAWKTIARYNADRTPKKNAYILFERGGVYRGTINVSYGFTYTAYGEGPKPIIMQSQRNYAVESLWKETEWENVYKCTVKLANVGVMAFDHDITDYSENSYNETFGWIMNKGLFGFKGPEDMNKDLQFYSVIPDDGSTRAAGDLYLYSTEGNPGKRFKSIEIGENYPIFAGSEAKVTIDNLSIKFTGGHGMSAGTCRDRTVTNCVFSWLGGSILSTSFNGGAPVNYGNAVEIYGGCNGYRVENNWMYQIYDTAVTHQYSDSSACTQEGVRYYGNLMELAFWGIEFYNAPPAKIETNSKTKYTRDVHIAYNVLRDGGYGWGSLTRNRSGMFYCGSSLSENYDELTEYNIFSRCSGHLLNLPSNATETQDKNIYIQDVGKTLGNLRGQTAVCGYDSAAKIAELWGDKNAVVVVIPSEVE